MKRYIRAALAIIALVAGTGATATPFTFDFSGTVTSVFDSGNRLGGVITTGTTFSGTVSYELTTPDNSPGNSGYGGYFHNPQGNLGISATMGGMTFKGDPGALFAVQIINGSSDWLTFDDFTTADWTTAVRANIALSDPGGTALTDDSLPTAAPNLAAFGGERRYQILGLENGSEVFRINGEISSISSLTSVPSPDTFTLLLAGMISLLRISRTKA